jgi:hypothetical protein
MSDITNETPCDKCKGTGFLKYFEDQIPCKYCCKHDQGWWELTKDYWGYKKGKDNKCCLAGCGSMYRDVFKTSDTPRTDADGIVIHDINGKLIYVNTTNLCKKLEREVNALQKALDQMTADAVKVTKQLYRSIHIADDIMAWETPAQARQSCKDLSQLKKEINEQEH